MVAHDPIEEARKDGEFRGRVLSSLDTVQKTLTDLSEKIRLHRAASEERHEQLERDIKELAESHDKRIRKLEDWRLYLLGAFTIAATIAGSVSGVLTDVIKSYLNG